MADPLSITTGVLSLVGAAWKISQTLMTLQTKFQRAPETVSSLVREFQATSVGLSQLNLLLKKRSDILQIGTSELERAQLLQCFDAMVLDMARTFSDLNKELGKLNMGESRPLALRMRFLWVESDLVEHTTRIRDQRSSLAYIMQVIQLVKTSDIHRELYSDSPGLSALKRTASRASQSRGPPVSSFSTSQAGVAGSSQAEPLNLDGILRRDTTFPDLDTIASAPPAAPKDRQPHDRASKPNQTGGNPCPPIPGDKQGGGAPSAAASEKITPNIVFHELHFNVAMNDINRVIMLLDLKHDPLGLPHDPHGSLPNAKKSALSLAAYLGRQEIMTIFLDRGFAWAIDKLIGTDLPPLLGAAYAGHEPMIRLLLSRGANPRLRGPGEATALFWASSRAQVEVVSLLLSTPAKDDINLPNAKGLTPLMVASQNRRGTQTVQILLANGADPTGLNAKGQSALHLACHAGHYAAIGLLLARSAKPSVYVNAATLNGKTSLMFASLSGHPDLCALLLASGAWPNSQDVGGKTALHHASSCGHGEVIETLLAHGGVSSEITTLQGDTALHIACEKGHARAVGALLAGGAKLETPRASDGMSALEIAIWYRRREILDPLILFQTQQDPGRFSKETALYSAAEWGLTETMDALIEAGADINALDSGGQTLLARAVREGKRKAVTCLISKGAEVDKADRFGSTPLHRIARGGNLDIAELLVNANVDVEARDGKGLTPLHVAAVYGTKEMVELLVLRGGARVGAVSDIFETSRTDSSCGQEGGAQQKTVFMMAAENRRKDVVEKLIWLGALPRDPKEISPYTLRDGGIIFVADALGKVEIVVQVDEA